MTMGSPREQENKPTTFTISASTSPEKIGDGVWDTEVNERENSQDSQGSQDTDDKGDSHNDDIGEQDNLEDSAGDDDKQKPFEDILFKKKDVKKPRAQSFQSVLSTASLKSLKQQSKTATNGRTASIIGSTTSLSNTRNFQSFIQAPVLSSISNLKSVDNVQIGQQLPFHDKDADINKDDEAIDETEDSYEYEDDEVLLQQQKLTLNALKKLSLSPMPITNSEDIPAPKSISRKTSIRSSLNGRNTQPYQPAQADLSSFASLTRQPKKHRINYPENVCVVNENEIKSPTAEQSAIKEPMSKPSVGSLERSVSVNKGDNEIVPDLVKSPVNDSDQDSKTITPSRSASDESGQTVRSSTSAKIPLPIAPTQTLNGRKKSPQQLQSSLSNVYGRPNHTQFQKSLKSNPRDLQSYQENHEMHASIPNSVHQKKLQQIKGFRNPMYIPAVLRKSMNGNISSEDGLSGIVSEYQSSHSEGSVAGSINGVNDKTASSHYLSVLQNSRLAGTQSSTDSVKSFDSNSSMDSTPSFNRTKTIASSLFNARKNIDGMLTSAPTKRHWLKDEQVTKCGMKSCSKEFNFFERRHHCRKCGGIYCKEHTSHYLYINHLAQFTTGGRGTLSKVCDNCIKEYNEFVQHEFGIIQSKKPSIHPHISPETSPKEKNQTRYYHSSSEVPKTRVTTNILPEGEGTSKDNRSDQLVGSVPANWSWSSF